MTDYEVEYTFQNIRFTDPADFGGKDTLFTIDDLDLSEDEKYELIDFTANHRNSGETDDFFYEFEYWQGDVISCTTMAYDDDELKAMTEGSLATSMGPTFKDRFILWNELPGFLKDKVKDYWGSKADMLYEWACSVEVDTDDDDFDVDIDDDYFDIADQGEVNKTAGNREKFDYTVFVDSNSNEWITDVTLNGSYDLELQILNDCLDRFRDRGGLYEEKVEDWAKDEIEGIVKHMEGIVDSGSSLKCTIKYYGFYYPDDDKAVIDNVRIWDEQIN